LKYAALQAFGEAEHVDRAMHRRFGGLDRIVLVVNRGCGTGEVVDFIDLDVQRKGHIVAHEFEMRVCMKMLDVVLGSCEEVIDAKDFVSIREQPVDQMGTEETGPPGY
jgi:hypothetical protein